MAQIFGALFIALCALAGGANAQQNRITRRIDNLQRVRLHGHVLPKARAENDRGRVSPSLNLELITLTLTQTAQQKADLDQLLADQQTAGSPNYHHWLTPEEYAGRFGVSADDMNQISGWMQSQGLTIASVARGRGWISVNGTAAQVEAAFQIELHQYAVAGETHFANASDPSLPAAFSGMVQSIRGLNDFRMKHAKRTPQFTSQTTGNHYLAPLDFATIYDILPVYKAGFDGTGQKLVIAGQIGMNLPDIQHFRSSYGLPANDPQAKLVPGSKDPGNNDKNGDLGEADLDIEWSGAVARNATVIYVYANDVMVAV
jgi:subtilase family serine protease